jgi:hypothetical protein
MDDNRWTIRVTSSALDGHSVAYARRHSFVGGPPLSFDVEEAHVTGLEYLLGALALELAGGIRRIAKKKRIDIDAVEVVVHGRLHNPLVYLRVIGEEGDPGLAAIEGKAYISSLAQETAVEEVWREVLAVSPVLNTLRKGVELRLSYQQML